MTTDIPIQSAAMLYVVHVRGSGPVGARSSLYRLETIAPDLIRSSSAWLSTARSLNSSRSRSTSPAFLLLLSTDRRPNYLTLTTGPLWIDGSLYTQVPRETVWKLRIGAIAGSHKPAERGERTPFRAPHATEKRAIRPAQRLSRQSLEVVFSEVQVRE